MNTINWNTYKFHCSGLSNLMVSSRKKDEDLSETTKTYLRELYLKEVWGRQKTDLLANKYVRKGIMCETDSIELVERVTGRKYFKNVKTFENEFIIGTPDIVDPLIDIKTSWDLFTFSSVDEEKALKDYYYQLLGYMVLTGSGDSILTYCLVNTPEEMINDELYKMSFKAPESIIDSHKNNYIFDDIPEALRVKQYGFDYSDIEWRTLQLKIASARNYLSSLSI